MTNKKTAVEKGMARFKKAPPEPETAQGATKARDPTTSTYLMNAIYTHPECISSIIKHHHSTSSPSSSLSSNILTTGSSIPLSFFRFAFCLVLL